MLLLLGVEDSGDMIAGPSRLLVSLLREERKLYIFTATFIRVVQGLCEVGFRQPIVMGWMLRDGWERMMKDKMLPMV